MNRKESICKLVKITNKIFEKNINNNLKNINLTDSQIRILGYLFYCYNNDIEINQIDIQNRFHLSNPTVSGILDRLSLKGFIERINNGRSNKIVLTSDGIELMKKEKNRLLKLEDKITDSLTISEKDDLRRILIKIINNNKIGDDSDVKKIS